MVQSIEDYSLQNISNQLNSKRNPVSRLYIKFPVFFRWRAIHKNACKGLHESTENCWSSFQNVNLERQSPLGVFCEIIPYLIFFSTEGRGATFVTSVRVHRRYHIYMYFLRKIISDFQPKEKYHIFMKKIPSFQIIQERSCLIVAFFEKTIFSERLKKISSYFRVFFLRKIIFLFPSKG